MEKEEIKRLKMISELSKDETFKDLLADFRTAKFYGGTISDHQIEDEKELAAYWLGEETKRIYSNLLK